MYARKWFNQNHIEGLQALFDILIGLQQPDQSVNLPSAWRPFVHQQQALKSAHPQDLYGIDHDKAREVFKQLGLIVNRGGKGGTAVWELQTGVTVEQAVHIHFAQATLPFEGDIDRIAVLVARIDQLERALEEISRRGDQIGRMARSALRNPTRH